MCVDLFHFLIQTREAVRKAVCIFDPQPFAWIVPAVIDKVGQYRHAALLDQFVIECFCDIQHLRFGGAIPEIIPAVVMEEGL